MIEGSRKLPVMHVSVRVPWHDDRWSGRVCTNPRSNTSCLILPRIAEKKDDDFETRIKGEKWNTKGNYLPACAAERGAFMAPFEYVRKPSHPYSDNGLYEHFKESPFPHPAYSAAAVPFAWMLKDADGFPTLAGTHKIDFHPEYEPDLGFETAWIQDRRNQLAMLDTFFSAVEPEESLVFFYAKNTPLTDDPRRVIVGIGRVLKVGEHVEYSYKQNTPPDALRCVLWERNLHHSIRKEIDDGFLLPYHDLIEEAQKNPDFDPSDFVLHAPEECWDAFSMGAEHVTHDQAITVLLSCATLLDRIEKVVPGDWHRARVWIDSQLNRIWRLRGAFPGLGSALAAFGLEHGTLIAHAISQKLHADGSEEIRDPWPLVSEILHKPDTLPQNLGATIGPTAARLWDGLKPERLALLKLLARFELSNNQAARWFVPEERNRTGLSVTDQDILKNPYLCFEEDRALEDPISVTTIDRGLFPDPAVSNAVPVPEPSRCPETIDPRRVRGLMLATLDQAANEGHTLLPQSWLVQRIRDMDISPACPISSDWIDTFKPKLEDQLSETRMADGSAAWQLREYTQYRNLISSRVTKRLAGKRHTGDYDWRGLIDSHLHQSTPTASHEAEEEDARKEKAIALEEIFRSRFSALIGPAGTGKTSLLTALISIPTVGQNGVLLLAPTGKARVQLQQRTRETRALTLAQFLLDRGRYDPKTGIYSVTGLENREKGYKTVIIDEASMLTEDQLAAAFDAIEVTAVERLILVGDPRQLPPIGAGRPFADIVYRLYEGTDPSSPTPKRPGYAELKIIRRQTEQSDYSSGVVRDDILLSRWFGGDATDPGADEAWARLISDKANGIKAIRWETDKDLQKKILEEIKTVTREIASNSGPKEEKTDAAAFETSLGGRSYREKVYFNPSRPVENGTGDAKQIVGGGADVESWQILSPIRSGEEGVDGLNRWLQKSFRHQAHRWAEPDQYWNQKVCKPLGPQGILYGDKVINLVNNRRRDVYPKEKDAYLANGEIGLVVGQYKGRKWKFGRRLPWKIEVEFSSKLGTKFGFGNRDFHSVEGDAPLELAYALTIHKSQGSEFGITIVVIPNPCRLLTRELLYTALTRHRDRVILFHQGDLRDLLKFSHAEHSSTAQRLTNLFFDPHPIEHVNAFLEERLIHRTNKGELVRSKSEVIVANILHSLGVTYAYEQPFPGQDGSIRYPDFTIEDAESGRRVFLEHLGMMSEPSYRSRWESKLNWYRSNGVLPVDEGEGNAGILVTTTEDKGIDSLHIEQQLRNVLGL